MRLYFFILFVIFQTFSASSQVNLDTINKYYENKKKDGLWYVYLDTRLNVTKIKDSAAFVMFEFYDKGTPVYTYSKKSKNFEITDGNKKSGITFFTGTLKFYDSKGLLSYKEIYENGKPKQQYAYRWQDGECVMEEVLDYSKKFEGQDWTFFYELYKDKTLNRSGYFRKDKKGWKVYFLN